MKKAAPMHLVFSGRQVSYESCPVNKTKLN